MSPGKLSAYDGTSWVPYDGAGPIDPPPPPSLPPPTFVLGTTEPNFTNVGIGIIRPTPVTVINGDVTLSGTQQLLDTIVNGRVTVTGGSPLIENCWIRGPVNPVTSGSAVWLIRCQSGTLTNIRFCRIEPQAPSSYMNGIGARNYIAYRCYVVNNTDNFSAYTTNGVNNVTIQGCYSPRMVHWTPDAANNRAETHNDTIQLEGNGTDPADILIEGNSFYGRHSTTQGTLPPSHSNLAAVMMTPAASQSVRCSATLKNNWFYGGGSARWTINAGAVSPGGVLIITGNRFERPGTQPSPYPTINDSMNINNDYTLTQSGNVYMDTGTGPVTIDRFN